MDTAPRRGPSIVDPGQTRAPLTLTALRVGVGGIMVVHGSMKLGDVPGWVDTVTSLGIPIPQVAAWLAIAGEVLGGAGLVVGLLTPIAALGVLATMLTAIFTVHLDHGLLADRGGFEYPLTIALVAAFFIARGAGPFSLDAVLHGRARRPTAQEGAGGSRSIRTTTSVPRGRP